MYSVDQIKILTITALLSDEELMATLVLKGGNALDLAYSLSSRASMDVDFSMNGDFSAHELQRIQEQSEAILNSEFNKAGLNVFDVTLLERPEIINEEVKEFWGGYKLEFKVIDSATFEKYKPNISQLRNRAIIIDGKSPKFHVDISKYEFVKDQQLKDIDGTVVRVYSPEMLALEKVRALCQQNPGYADIIKSNNRKSRARDFYDIHNLITSFDIDFTVPRIKELAYNIFNAKFVPLDYISQLPDQYEFHRQSWESVRATVNAVETLEEFDFYYEFVIDHANRLL